MGDSTKFLMKSPYIKDLAMMVIGYGMAINIVEVNRTMRRLTFDYSYILQPFPNVCTIPYLYLSYLTHVDSHV